MTEAKPKPKRKRRATAEVEQTAASKRAAEIRAMPPPAAPEQPGQVVGGHDGWHYVVLPEDMGAASKAVMVRKLSDRGFELETDNAVVVSGHHNATLYRIPQEIHKENRARVKQLVKQASAQARTRNILHR